MNMVKVINDWMGGDDWQIKENSNNIPNVGALSKFIVGEASKDYWLKEVIPDRLSKHHVDGDMHFHDLGALTLYCCGYSLENILLMGVQGVPNIPASKPAKHFGAILNQVANLITVYQNEISGAVAFNSFDTLLAPFIKVDNLTYEEVKQEMQNFIFSVNSNSRGGAEPAFSNLTFDLYAPKDLAERQAIVGGLPADFKFGDCQEEMDMLNRAFFEIMYEGDAQGKLFSYPIPTYNIHEKFNWDNPNNTLLWEMAGKYGIPYFANFIGSDLRPDDVRSMCPLTPDTKVITRVDEKYIVVAPIGELYEKQTEDSFVEVWNGVEWVRARLTQQDLTEVLRVTCANGSYTDMGVNHQQPTLNKGTVAASELEVGDLIPFERGDYGIFVTHGVEKVDDGTYKYFEIEKIEKVETDAEHLYCFAVEDDKHFFCLENGMITHNCRLRLDLKELRRKNGGLFGAGDSTGSISVCTLNLPRIGYEAADEEEFFDILLARLEVAKEVSEIRRDWIQKNVFEKGMIPAFQTYVGTLDNHFSTIGVVGMNEMCENFLGRGIDTPEGKAFALKVGDFIRETLSIFQEETGHLYNYEATPAESTAYRLARKDLKKYPDIVQQGMETNAPYYTNSCHVPVAKVTSISENFAHQNELQQQFTGGTVIHNYLDGAISGEQAKAIVRDLCENFQVPYISLSPISRYCDQHGYVKKEVDECPQCGAHLKKYQRITGYLRNVDNFNAGKAQEFADRIQFKTAQ